MAARAALRLQQILKHSDCRPLRTLSPWIGRSYCSAVNIYNEKDPAPYFFDARVQDILKKLTAADLNKVFRTRMFEKKLKVPKYQFMTKEELEQQIAEAKEKSDKILQMPPVMKERETIDEVLSRDPALIGYETAKLIFTDITYGMSDRKRVVVVRDPDGTLRKASWDERTRMNQIYNPRPGRKLIKPKMFEEETLKDVLAREKYEFVLDRACTQFEPDDPDYQKVCSMTYEAIDEKRKYDMLISTRHYGPMCFYLAWHRKIDKLLIEYIQQEKLSDGVSLIQLHYHIHKDGETAIQDIDPNEHISFVKTYAQEDSLRRPQLQLAIQQYEDLLHERQQYEETVQKSHGL
ncbi:small ribosomal subunit protein mS22 [Palaemon carinicauda]|uniref:small ribosomal subunit protein mS22 n=1 Tax=Palaemon carinicauda TaxID=392227 RepID=UPI0035B5785A